MFHKEGSIQGRKKAMDVPLRKSDRRRVRERALNFLNANHPDDLATSTTLSQLLDETFLQGNLSSRALPLQGRLHESIILYLKTPSGDNSAAWPYSTSSQFVWMALEEKGGKIHSETPTVAFWAVLAPCLVNNGNVKSVEEALAPYVVQVPSQVSKFVCRGADLMKAGMRSLPPSSSQKMVAIVAQGNPQPFAVGQLKLSNDDRSYGPDTKGVGVEIWNAYGDEIWRFSNTKEQCKGTDHVNSLGGTPFDNGHYGNVGFQDGKRVYPIVASGESDEEDEEADANVETPGMETSTGPTTETPNEQSETTEPQESTTTNEDGNSEGIVPATAEQSPASPPASLSPDEVLHNSVCQALVSLKNKDLPMPVGTFYAQHVIPSRPEGYTIDVKATQYKKFGNYLKAQVDHGLLQVGPDPNNKKNTDQSALLIAYYKKHDDLQNFSKATRAPTVEKTKLVLVNLYMFPQHWPALLRLDDDDVKATNASSEERRGTGMLTQTEVRKVVEAYIAREELVPAGRKERIQLDGPLTKVLYKKEENPPEFVLRKDINKIVTKHLLPAYAVVQMPGSKIETLAKGQPPKIEIEVSRRQSKKFVTRVRGLEDYNIDAPYFSKDVAKRFACSASVETTTPAGRPALRKNHVEVVFQGNLVDELEALLTGEESLSSHGGVQQSDYAVPPQVLKITLRKGVPDRKKGGKTKK